MNNHDVYCPLVTYTNCPDTKHSEVKVGWGCKVCGRWCFCDVIALVRQSEHPQECEHDIETIANGLKAPLFKMCKKCGQRWALGDES